MEYTDRQVEWTGSVDATTAMADTAPIPLGIEVYLGFFGRGGRVLLSHVLCKIMIIESYDA